MEKELLPVKTIIKNGFISGLIYVIGSLIIDYFTDEPFSWVKYIVNFIIFGTIMAMFFRYRYVRTKEED